MGASKFLQKKANTRAKEIDKKYGEGQYGGTWWQDMVKNNAEMGESPSESFLQRKMKEINSARTVKPESTQTVVSGSGAQKDKKFDAGQYAEDAGKLFLNGVAEGVAATGAAVENWIGKGLDKLFPGAGFEGSGLFNVLYNGRPDWKWAGENGLVGIKQDREYNQESLQENAERIDGKVMKKAAEFGGDIAYGLGNAAPMAATAMVTGGASAAAALTKEGLLKTGAEVVEKSGVLNSMSQAARDMLTSRDYWTSFASEVGMDYYDALDSGATEDEALRYALSSAGLNSVIEIGGGIQKIPEKPTFRTWLKSAHEEGMEEIQQGIVSRLLENVVYNKGNPIASVTDENAVLNTVTALGEYAGGAAVGGILSGGQQLTRRGINNAQYKRAYGTSAQDLVKESLEMNPDNALATKLQKKLEAGKKLTGSELRQLVEQNEIDMVNGDRATIQTAAEARLTELGETENVPQVAEAIARQAAGERITDAEKTLLEGSERARQVRQELNPENIRVGATDEEWTGKIGTARVNRAAYNRGIQENGVTGAKYNAETGKLDAIVKDEQGKIKTVPAEKAELSPLQEELFDWATDLGEAGPVLVSAYRQTQNLETYARQFHNAYEYGKAGVPMDYVNKSQAVSYLNTTQREIAYEEGAKAHQRELQGRQERKRSGGAVDNAAQKKPTVSLRGTTMGGVKYAPVNKKAMDGRQWASVGTMKAFAQATGVNVVFYESQANERGEYEGANGFYKNGTLYLDINAGRDRVAMGETAILKTAAHEVTHYIKEGSTEQYEVLKNFVVEKLTREKGLSIDDLVTDKQRREPGLSYEEAVDEVVADACEMMLKDSKAVEQLARENRSLAERIRQWIRKWVRSLKAAMEGLTADRPESRAMMQYAQELQEIWDNALVDAVRNGRGTMAEAQRKEKTPNLGNDNTVFVEDGVWYSVRENFSKEIDSWVKDDMPEGVRFTLGSTGPVMQGLGAIESDIYMEGDKIKKIMQDHPEMTLAEIKKVPQILEDPALILKSEGRGKSGANSRLVCFGLTKAQNGQPVMTVMDLRPRENGFVVDDMQKVNSAYTKNNPMAFIQKSDVVYADKKRAIPLLRTTGLTISSQRLLRNGYIGSISYKGSSVNIEGVPFSSVVKMEANDKVQNSMRDSVKNAKIVRGMQADYWDDQSYRAHRGKSVMSEFGHAMFMDDPGSIEIYGNNRYSVFKEDLTSIDDLKRKIAEQWDRDKERGFLPHQYMEEMSGEEAADNFDPTDIVDSAQAWDNEDMVQWFFAHEDLFENTPGVKTSDGAVVWDESIIYKTDFGEDGVMGSSSHEERLKEEKRPQEESNEKSNEKVRFSLRSVPPVKPKNGGWERGATFDEVKIEHPTLFALDADESSTRNPTQISGTVKSYRKIFDALKEEGFDGTILDASSGLGYGTRLGREEYGYRVDDIEPFPDAKYKPRYTDYSALDNTYDAIISNAVLNVIPQDLRDAMVVKIGEMLNPGGRAFINVRGTDVKNASSKVAINESGMEYFISNTGSYQKGFTTKELVAYLRDALGDGFTVRATNKFGAVSAIVTKNEERVQSQQREPRLSDRAVLEWAAEMALRDKNKRWTAKDREQLERFRNRMRMLQDTQAELEALKEERKVLLAGRKVSEITGEERTEVSKNKNRIDIAKNKVERYEAAVWELESKAAIKTLLEKSRSIVETEASYQARKEYRERQEEREMVNVTRRKVERNAKRLLEYMNTNTDKKHIPEALKKPIGELLESLNFFSNSARRGGYTSRADLKYYEAMQGLQAALATQRAFDDTGEGTDVFKGYLDLPAGFESLLAVHVERVKNVVEKHPLKTDVLKMMDLGDLRDLDVILSVMSRSVTKMNEMFIKRRFAYVADAAEDSIFAMQRLGQHQDKPGERFALWDNTLPWYAFQRFGEGGKAVFEGLQDGWDKLAFNMKTILDFKQGLISDAQARKWDTETHKVELTDPDGSKVTATLTTAQLMSLYCLSKRKQALGHLLGGGIRPDAIEVTNTLGDKIKKKKWNQDKQFKLTEESLGQLLKLLTPEQIKVADAMQKFMTEQGSAWGNAISMERFGYRAFTEQNYFPIETDRQDREAKTGDAKEGSLYRLQNISAVKPLVKNANNALILRGIFDVFANHTADMAKYNAMVLPIIDAQKWYNYRYGEKNEAGQVNTRTVQRAMTKAYGEVANNFVIKYLQDLNGVKENGDRGDTIPKRMISNYKRAMVAANMRVALLQPTAYARASAVLDYKYLLKAFKDKTGTKQATKEMMENSGIALWKSLGFFDTDVGRSIRDQIKGKSSKIDDLVDKTMVPAEKGDEVTWARLWRACKLEVQDMQHLTGEELLNATAERFREVIYRTQVVDSTMTRSHAMRGSGTLTKMATSFMSEPTVSYNMVMECTRQIAEDAKRMGLRTAIRRNWKTAGRAYQAYIVSAIVTAIVESLYDALRDSDDDKYLDKVWKALGGEKPETVKDGILDVIFGLNGNLAGDINPIGKVPYLRDVVSILGGYSNGRMDTEAVANLKKAIDIWDEVIRLQTGDLDKATKTTYYGNMTTYGMIYPTAKALSQLTGLPGSAAMREVATAWNTTVGTVWPALKMRTYEDKKLREAWENYGKASGVSYAVMYRAIQDLKEIESDRDADGNAISGSLKAKYVEYIRGMGLTRAQEKAVWEAAKNSSWSDKGTPWG